MRELRVEGVWKSYPRWPAGARTLRSIAARRMPLLARRGEQRWVLRDVTLAAGPGSSVGVIGRNGAGKSTLLRLASGLGQPTRGTVRGPAGVASVLTLGDTFDPTLSGRENAETAAIVSGWTRREARELLPAIFAFAELEEFGDAPVRTYSEGMKLRLAFGVVAQLDPDVLLIDEVIAVGDLAFQAKCMDRIRELRERGAALILASHDLRLIERECERAVWLEDGAIAAAGETGEVVGRYEEAARERTLSRTPEPAPGAEDMLELRRNRVGTQEATIDAVELDGGEQPGSVASGNPLTVSVTLSSTSGPLLDPIVALAIHREADGALCFEANTRDEGVAVGRVSAGTVSLVIARLDLAPGRYLLDVGLYRADWDLVYDFHWHAYPLEVSGRAGGGGALDPPRRWNVRGD
jgi:lipopolysaccharide transport system ATP-binding protein